MVRSEKIFNAVISKHLNLISSVIFEKNTITIRGSLIFLIFVFIFLKLSFISGFELDCVFNITRIFFLIKVF
jgi:hypothetical protein